MSKHPIFNPDTKCPKCDGDDVAVMWHAGGCDHKDCDRCHSYECKGGKDEHFVRTCRRCHFAWFESVLPSEAKASFLGRLRELEQAATPGPWAGPLPLVRTRSGRLKHQTYTGEIRDIPDADAALIVALRNAAPELLRVVEAARYFRAEQESDDVNLDLAEALWQDLCAALDALEEKGNA